MHRSPCYSNNNFFKKEIIRSVSIVIDTYDAIIVTDDFNTDLNKVESIGHDKLDGFVTNLILPILSKLLPCYTSNCLHVTLEAIN